MAVQGEPEAEADPQFFYPNTYPVYNNYYHPGFYPVVRTPLVQKATVVQKTPEVKAKKPAVLTQYPTAFYPTQTLPFYQPFLRYSPVVYYPTSYPGFLQPSKPALVSEEDDVDDAEVINITRDAMTQETHKVLSSSVGLVVDPVNQAPGRQEFEDGLRKGVQLEVKNGLRSKLQCPWGWPPCTIVLTNDQIV